jgi:ribose 5-phosphate isomerase B
MRIALGSDHAGYDLKQRARGWLRQRGAEVVDLGPQTLDPADDYPDYAQKVAESVVRGEADLGLMICSTGVGSCIAANKVAGVRAALCSDTSCARMSRSHNDANVLCLGAHVVDAALARDILDTWLDTPFSGDERHLRRLDKIALIESRLR